MGKFEIQSMPLQKSENNFICAHSTCKGLYFNETSNAPNPSSSLPNGLCNGLTNGVSKSLTNDVQNLQNGLRKVIISQNGLASNNLEEVEEEDETLADIPPGMEILINQVAGHTIQDSGGVGMLKKDGLVFKPLLKKDCAEREIRLYEQLKTTVDRSLIEMRQLVPKYHGVQRLQVKGKEIEFLVLEDLTKDFKEPCIMDIKIGRRTWDPTAGYDKIIAEENKYHECKRDLGFCIPGFQIYKIATNQLVKYDKEYGKSLNKDSAKEVYDARRLREHVEVKKPIKSNRPSLVRQGSLYRPLSMAQLNNGCEKVPTGFSGQLTLDGPILKAPSKKIVNLEGPRIVNNNNTWQKSIHALKRTHSFQNNYDKDVQNQKQNYTFMLDDLCCESKSEVWATAKLIDFAHVYPSDLIDVDKNYLEGVESLTKMFEDFLSETDNL